MVKEKVLIKKIYPETVRKKLLGTKKHFQIFSEARTNQHSVNLMVLRASLAAFFSKGFFINTKALHPRDVWKSNRRLYALVEVILKEVLTKTVHEEFDAFHILQNFRLTLLNDYNHDFKLAVLDKRTNSFGMIICCNKWVVKDATVKCMEEMRFCARSRNIDDIWGVATDLYSWYFIHYSKKDELEGKKDFYTMTDVYPCYVKNN